MAPIYDLASVFTQQIATYEREAGRVYEAVIALVTDNKDPSKIGRVKIKIPVLSSEDVTWWAPVVMHGAGVNRGWFFIPEVDDEVLVLFEHGDLDRPIIVVALWNGVDKAPDKNPGDVPRKVIKSRAGSRILFDDENKKMVIEDGGGKGRITIEASSNKITIEALAGDVCLQSPTGDFTIVANAAEFTASANLEIHAGGAMAWGTDASATIKGGPVTLAGSKVNINCGSASAPPAPSTSPAAVADPYTS
jgi:uncharacterized protein involved in type VI secretion and phage assembly